MLNLPEFSAHGIRMRLVLWFVVFGLIGAGYLAYRHEHTKPRPAHEVNTGLKSAINPDSLMKGF
jgi:hypothetical protein